MRVGVKESLSFPEYHRTVSDHALDVCAHSQTHFLQYMLFLDGRDPSTVPDTGALVRIALASADIRLPRQSLSVVVHARRHATCTQCFDHIAKVYPGYYPVDAWSVDPRDMGTLIALILTELTVCGIILSHT